jgi:hypothetical protein
MPLEVSRGYHSTPEWFVIRCIHYLQFPANTQPTADIFRGTFQMRLSQCSDEHAHDRIDIMCVARILPPYAHLNLLDLANLAACTVFRGAAIFALPLCLLCTH